MSPLYHSLAVDSTPDFLTIGHVTRDLLADGSFELGGTVSFAALTTYRLGLVSAIATCADTAWFEFVPTRLPSIGLAGHVCSHTTTFVNRYSGEGFRTQYLRDRADDLLVEDIPPAWKDAPIVLFGPLAQEFTPELVRSFPRGQGRILAATPQGWLRRWDDDGRVWPTPWTESEEVLPLLDVLILSHDDLLPFADGSRTEADAILARWSMQVPLLVATDGRHGATLFRNGVTERFPAYAASEVDPTGAGDVFAAAFLTYLSQHGDPRQAVDFANCVASLSIEKQGAAGIPTREEVDKRLELSGKP
ncbi:MAG TPA: PfkB family carbohydrate kinase [Ktedonobacteraceae bacterium]|nr:PfkB family carbohydrate kinase [Ktedonobacteraceae bacterium]